MLVHVAFAKENPRPGIIINKAYGPDVYYGVPKYYTGQNATVHNLLAVILGNRSALTGAIPYGNPLYAKDLTDTLKRKYEAKAYKSMLENAPEGSQQNIEAEKKLNKEISQRKYMDTGSINLIATSLFGQKDVLHLLEYVRPAGQPLVDDWDCLKMFVKIYEEKCGALTTYGKKYARAMANMGNFGINEEQMIVASTKACSN
ncbi:hypothetical protein Dsin_012991 [Dipteronia sinensis]|uniref:Legumain prodomain domain-containing protein n=1 Tax=Dipteronia sinensis TaxID=43782 RepID=A0AAE0E8J9_9ROSI|nr:hypothetical protein Dsin_012991 [Dipteronia sinensis]